MQAHDLLKYFEKFPNLKTNFLGFYAIDTLPHKLKYRHFFIGNTDKSSGEGIHWFCCIKVKPKTIELFDSLGINDSKKQFYLTHLQFTNIELEINRTQFQPNDSVLCGKYVVYFLINRLFNLDLPLKVFLKSYFTDKLDENDSEVTQFCNEILI